MPVWDFMAAAPDALRVVELDDSEGDLVEAVRASRAYLLAGGRLRWRTSGPGRRRHHRRRGHQRHLPAEPDQLPRHRGAGRRRPVPGGGRRPGRRSSACRRRAAWSRARPPGRRAGGQPDHPGRPRRGGRVRRSPPASTSGTRSRWPWTGPAAGALLDAAEAAGLRVGCAPDTFLGAGLQTTRRLIERGDIGTPLTALVLMQSPGPGVVAPQPGLPVPGGGGPAVRHRAVLPDRAGADRSDPVASVAAVGSKSRETRIIGSGPKAGEEFAVTVPSHVSASAQFESGQSATMIFSFDSARAADAAGDHRHRGDHAAARTRTCSTVRSGAQTARGRETVVATTHRCCRRGAPACSTWRGRSGRAGRTGPRGRWPTTCWTS